MQVRLARPGELDALGELCVAAYEEFMLGAEDGYRVHVRDTARRAGEAELWVAADDERLLGCVTYCPPGSPWRELATSADEPTAAPVDLAGLAPERILLLDEGHCFRDQTIAACRLDSDPSARTFAATSLSTIVEFVANGQGVTLLPQIALRKEATDPRIAIHALASPGAGRLLSLVWREANPFSATFETMAQLIARVKP